MVRQTMYLIHSSILASPASPARERGPSSKIQKAASLTELWREAAHLMSINTYYLLLSKYEISILCTSFFVKGFVKGLVIKGRSTFNTSFQSSDEKSSGLMRSKFVSLINGIRSAGRIVFKSFHPFHLIPFCSNRISTYSINVISLSSSFINITGTSFHAKFINNAGPAFRPTPQRDPIFRDAKVLLFWCDQQQKE